MSFAGTFSRTWMERTTRTPCGRRSSHPRTRHRTGCSGRIDPMAKLIITRGLPGSGKTTWAKAQPGTVRVNRDELRRMMHGGHTGEGWAERQITVAQRAQIDA